MTTQADIVRNKLNRSKAEVIREHVAGAARALWLSDIGPTLSLQSLLKTEPGARIVWRQACTAMGETASLQGFAMFSAERRRVADAAQWLWLNRECCSLAWLILADSDYIKRAHNIAKTYSERLEVKKYSLSDLQRAYDLGFGTSGEGWNQEIHPDYVDKENYQAERK